MPINTRIIEQILYILAVGVSAAIGENEINLCMCCYGKMYMSTSQ